MVVGALFLDYRSVSADCRRRLRFLETTLALDAAKAFCLHLSADGRGPSEAGSWALRATHMALTICSPSATVFG